MNFNWISHKWIPKKKSKRWLLLMYPVRFWPVDAEKNQLLSRMDASHGPLNIKFFHSYNTARHVHKTQKRIIISNKVVWVKVICITHSYFVWLIVKFWIHFIFVLSFWTWNDWINIIQANSQGDRVIIFFGVTQA